VLELCIHRKKKIIQNEQLKISCTFKPVLCYDSVLGYYQKLIKYKTVVDTGFDDDVLIFKLRETRNKYVKLVIYVKCFTMIIDMLGALKLIIFLIYDFQLRAFIFTLNNMSYMLFLPHIVTTKVTSSQQS
jgi:hypothetical protein